MRSFKIPRGMAAPRIIATPDDGFVVCCRNSKDWSNRTFTFANGDKKYTVTRPKRIEAGPDEEDYWNEYEFVVVPGIGPAVYLYLEPIQDTDEDDDVDRYNIYGRGKTKLPITDCGLFTWRDGKIIEVPENLHNQPIIHWSYATRAAVSDTHIAIGVPTLSPNIKAWERRLETGYGCETKFGDRSMITAIGPSKTINFYRNLKNPRTANHHLMVMRRNSDNPTFFNLKKEISSVCLSLDGLTVAAVATDTVFIIDVE